MHKYSNVENFAIERCRGVEVCLQMGGMGVFIVASPPQCVATIICSREF